MIEAFMVHFRATFRMCSLFPEGMRTLSTELKPASRQTLWKSGHDQSTELQIAAVSSLLVLLSIAVLGSAELLRRRSDRLRTTRLPAPE